MAISLPFTDSDFSATDTATIDWGDGTADDPDVSAAAVTPPSGPTPAMVTGSHGKF